MSRPARGRLGTYARAHGSSGSFPSYPSHSHLPDRPPRTQPRRRNGRRRQRSVRVTVSVSLLGVASALVVAALPTRSVLWLSLASVSALVLSWAALRMMWTEVLQSRRENAADRVGGRRGLPHAVHRPSRRARRVHHGDDRAARGGPALAPRPRGPDGAAADPDPAGRGPGGRGPRRHSPSPSSGSRSSRRCWPCVRRRRTTPSPRGSPPAARLASPAPGWSRKPERRYLVSAAMRARSLLLVLLAPLARGRRVLLGGA